MPSSLLHTCVVATHTVVAMPDQNGMTKNNNLSYLQTPTYQIVTVFVIFIFVSLTIEKMLMRVRHRIEGSGTKGLMHAFQAVMNELVLLGFLSFLLEIFGPVRPMPIFSTISFPVCVCVCVCSPRICSCIHTRTQYTFSTTARLSFTISTSAHH